MSISGERSVARGRSAVMPGGRGGPGGERGGSSGGRGWAGGRGRGWSRGQRGGGAAPRRGERIRTTNKALEGRQFSTIRLPRHSEVGQTNTEMIHELEAEAAEESAGRRQIEENTAAAAAKGVPQFSFDPIISDPMFIIPKEGQYWPPPPLEKLLEQYRLAHPEAPQAAAEGQSASMMSVDGMDLYDRRADEREAKKAMKIKRAKGELVHPRGKAPVNTRKTFEDSDGSDGHNGDPVAENQSNSDSDE